jgi:hypothetical protein
MEVKNPESFSLPGLVFYVIFALLTNEKEWLPASFGLCSIILCDYPD